MQRDNRFLSGKNRATTGRETVGFCQKAQWVQEAVFSKREMLWQVGHWALLAVASELGRFKSWEPVRWLIWVKVLVAKFAL